MARSYFSGAQYADIVIQDASSWVFANTGLKNGDHFPGLLGYEVDRMYRHAPHGTRRIVCSPYLDIAGKHRYSDMTYYVTAAGSTVVATGSMNWNWDWPNGHPMFTNPAVQQATRNILKRFGATDPKIA